MENSSSILGVYNRINLDIDYAKGMYIYTKDKSKYIDFVSGVAVNCLGHSNPKLIKALEKQAKSVWHVSNFFNIPGMEEFSNLLTKNSFANKVFFCNSGAEAIECAIKSIRKYHDATGNPDKYRIITFTGAFHGRTLAAIWASKRDAMMQEGFGPPVDGFDNVEFDSIEAVKNAINENTGGILIEPIQGDGGIRVPSPDFIKGLRKLADEHGLLLCFDEIQAGIGRTGKFLAHELFDVTPDIATCAKGIGGGFPLGACLLTDKAAIGMTIGTHGSTYGGNPLAMAVGKAVVEEIIKTDFLANVVAVGSYLKVNLNKLKQKYPNIIKEIRGKGLLLGIQFIPDNKIVQKKLVEHKLLLAPAADNVLRIIPPLNISNNDVNEAIAILDTAFGEL